MARLIWPILFCTDLRVRQRRLECVIDPVDVSHSPKTNLRYHCAHCQHLLTTWSLIEAAGAMAVLLATTQTISLCKEIDRA